MEREVREGEQEYECVCIFKAVFLLRGGKKTVVLQENA